MRYVYILRCKDGSFYTGASRDAKERTRRHNRGRGSGYTRLRIPVELVYSEEFETKAMATKREIEIKRLSAENKKRLIKFGSGERFPSAHIS